MPPSRVEALVIRHAPIMMAILAGASIAASAMFSYSHAREMAMLCAGTSLIGAGLLARSDRDAARQRMKSGAMQGELFEMDTILSSAPMAYATLNIEGHVHDSFGLGQILGQENPERLDDLSAHLRPNDVTRLLRAWMLIRRNGRPFRLDVSTQEGRMLRVHGKRGRGSREMASMVTFILWFQDIGEMVKGEDEHRRAILEERAVATAWQSVLDTLPIPVWLRHADGRIAWCNKTYAQAVGLSLDDVIKDQVELAPQMLRDGAASLGRRTLATRQPQSETRHVVVGGQRRLLVIQETPTENVEKAVVGTAVDQTQREEVEAELARHISAHAEVLEHLSSAIAIYGSDTRLKFFNRAYQRLWGAEEAFLLGEPSFSEILEDLRTRRRAPEQIDFQHYKRERLGLFTSLIEPHEDMMHLPDGTTLRVLAVPHPFGGLMFVHEDVTDRLALESSYNTLIAVQQETLDNLAEGIAVFGSDGRLKLSNPAFARIWRLDTNSLASSPRIGDLLEQMKPLFDYGDKWEDFKNEMTGYALDRVTRAGRMERTDHSVVKFNTVPLPDGAVLNCYLDVTDSVQIEQALRATNSALAAADRLKSEFVANVSYQLRTPLNTIMGFAEILANQYFGTLNERQLEYARTIMDASKRLLLLINDVLDLAMIESGRMALHYQAVDVPTLLQETASMTREWARQQLLEILIDCDSEIGTIQADEHRLKQALFNLISNAIQYTPPGGRITMAADIQDGWLTLSVIDTGIGISVDDQERVFSKFERANIQHRQAGVGLGLSLVKSFIELHGGHVDLESRINHGTRVTCVMPVRPQAVLATPPEKQDAPPPLPGSTDLPPPSTEPPKDDEAAA